MSQDEKSEPLTQMDQLSVEKPLKHRLILGPMVRVSTFPLRLLCLKYGADIVYSPELLDYKLINTNKQFNIHKNKNNNNNNKNTTSSNIKINTLTDPLTKEKHSTIDWMDKQRKTKVIFRTFCNKKEPVIVQIGSCNAAKFLQAATMVHSHVNGINLNMGCPKSFSVSKGMGAALLNVKKFDIVEDIFKTFYRNMNDVDFNSDYLSVKIRINENIKETIQLCQNLNKIGVNQVTIHSRYVKDRTELIPSRIKLFSDIYNHLMNNSSTSNMIFNFNGDILDYNSILKVENAINNDKISLAANKKLEKNDIGGSMEINNINTSERVGYMVSRGAMWNASIFDHLRNFGQTNMKNVNDVVKEYGDICNLYHYPIHNSKFVMEKMLLHSPYVKKRSKLFKSFHQSQSFDICNNINKQIHETVMIMQQQSNVALTQ